MAADDARKRRLASTQSHLDSDLKRLIVRHNELAVARLITSSTDFESSDDCVARLKSELDKIDKGRKARCRAAKNVEDLGVKPKWFDWEPPFPDDPVSHFPPSSAYATTIRDQRIAQKILLACIIACVICLLLM